MRDDELRGLLRSLDEPHEPDQGFGDQLFEQLSVVAPRRRSRIPLVLLAAALLVAALAAGAVVGGAFDPQRITSEATPMPSASVATAASESGAPSATAEPSPPAAPALAYTAPAGVVPPAALVRATEAFDLRAWPSTDAEVIGEVAGGTELSSGETLLVDDRPWLRLATNTGYLNGYLELDEQHSQVEVLPVACPTAEPALEIIGRMSDWERLACFGDRELTIEGWEVTGFGGFRYGTYTPEWLNGFLGELAVGGDVATDDTAFCCLWASVEPGTVDTSREPVHSITGSHLRLTGHFNDPASVECRARDLPISDAGPEGRLAEQLAISAELGCRERFVMTSMEVLEPPAPAPTPASEPMNGLLPLGAHAEVVVDALNIRGEPGLAGEVVATLARGATVIVERQVENLPREVDNLVWYLVRADDGGASGWAAVADAGTPYLRGLPVPCPTGSGGTYEFSTLAGSDPWSRAACAAEESVTIQNVLVYHGCTGTGWTGDGTYTPNWLTDDPCTDYWLLAAPVGDQTLADLFDLPHMSFVISPGGPPIPESGLVANVTGHFFDPAWQDCEIQSADQLLIVPGVAQLYCQQQFVIDSFEVVGTSNLPL